MKDILQYFDLIAGTAECSGAESAELDFVPAGQTSGTVTGVFYFYDGSRLEFTERVAIEKRHPVKIYYRYQYVRGNAAVFRYDNANHHPGLSNYPHHKHSGEEILPAIEPALGQILDEVFTFLRESLNTPASTKRRRQRRNPQDR
jgi:hypothetical protein